MDHPPIESNAPRPISDTAYQIAVILTALLLIATVTFF